MTKSRTIPKFNLHNCKCNCHFNCYVRRFNFLFFFFWVAESMTIAKIPPLISNCSDSGPIKPSTPLLTFLEKLQDTALVTFGKRNFDPKRYVDMPLKFDLTTTERAFQELPRSKNGEVSMSELEGFLCRFLNEAGSDLAYYEPADFVPEPAGFLPEVENPEVRAWALEVHSLWKNLSRRVVVEFPELHTLLPLPNQVVVPGSRFREVYYWDSYWVVRGLLASKMYDTAKAIVYNLLSLIDTYGYVLNGARSYYSNRSQPPLLSAMVLEIYNRTGDLGFVKTSLPALLREHQFWNSGIQKVSIQDHKGCNHTLSRYYAMWNKPRPESSTTDKESASKLFSDDEKQHFYRELASAAESGWDFSSRWMRNQSDFSSLATTSIIPVDLNAILLKMEIGIANLAMAIGENSTAKRFMEASCRRENAMRSIFWNATKGQWLDYWLDTCTEDHKWEAKNQNQNVFASNFIPIWIDSFKSDEATVEKVVKSIKSSGLLCDAGIATSLSETGQQWDFPNGWAPLQHMIVEGLAKSSSREARSLAEDIVIRWIRTNYAAYKKTGAMHEKYDVRACGAVGGGGEYIPQTGFGWSNGVVLAFLEDFGWPKERKIDC